MLRRVILGTIAALALSASAGAPSALGHKYSSWFWGSIAAERSFETRYDVISVDCNGFGKYMRGRYGVRLYRHFDCYVLNYDGKKEYDELHVTGRRGFVVYD